jgi:hypothetical protein
MRVSVAGSGYAGMRVWLVNMAHLRFYLFSARAHLQTQECIEYFLLCFSSHAGCGSRPRFS